MPAIALLFCALTRPAAAQTEFSVERFRLSTDRDGLLDVEWGSVPGHLNWDLGLWLAPPTIR
jgi:hypothetical protein